MSALPIPKSPQSERMLDANRRRDHEMTLAALSKPAVPSLPAPPERSDRPQVLSALEERLDSTARREAVQDAILAGHGDEIRNLVRKVRELEEWRRRVDEGAA